MHPNNAARRKSRLMAKVNAAHLLDGRRGDDPTAAKKRTTASKTAQRKKVAAAKASKAAAGKATDRPRTAAGKAKVAVTRASRESAAARRRAKTEDEPEDEPRARLRPGLNAGALAWRAGDQKTSTSRSSLMSPNRCSTPAATNATEPGVDLDHLVADGQRAAPGRHVVHLVLGMRLLIVD